MNWKKEDVNKYDYYPVLGNPKNGFYPVAKGTGTHEWNGKKIVPKTAIVDKSIIK